MEDEARIQRLQDRFEAIREAVAIKKGYNFSLAVAFAAWLMAIEHATALDFEHITEEHVAKRKNQQLRENFQSFHRYVCEKLKVNPNEVLDLVPSFKEILHDIIRGKG